ncbi:MAG: BrnT family toxin [Caldilineaceae bacterium]|nr:BrnT family toxin [Caldilineaceae bacterium]HRJ40615.1 BrnT family toxin [Caldilineaceae bacterium]
MRYTWDEVKRQKTLMERGLDFSRVSEVFGGPVFTVEDDRWDYGEDRWVTIGLLGFKVVVVVHTESDDEIHVISLREATRNEQRFFFSNQ